MTATETPAPGMTTLPGAGTNWQAYGLCRQVDPDLFFPKPGTGLTSTAKRICLGCEVRVECMEYALAYDERGVWGGTTTGQRKAIRRARRHEIQTVAEYSKGDRDRTILQLTHAGLSAAEIAERLGCASRTVTRIRTAHRQGAAA